MKEVTQALEVAREKFCVPLSESELTGPMADLMHSAQRWSAQSLECFTGEMLRKALALAAAMADVAHEMQNPS